MRIITQSTRTSGMRRQGWRSLARHTMVEIRCWLTWDKDCYGSGFQKGDDVLETLKDGSIFTDILHEHWRHQLLKYDIVSFWGAMDNVSTIGHALPLLGVRLVY